jgi:hypothetical protein
MTLELCVRMAYRIPGEIIEFGVADGGSTRVLRRALSECERGQIGGARTKIRSASPDCGRFSSRSFSASPEGYGEAPMTTRSGLLC